MALVGGGGGPPKVDRRHLAGKQVPPVSFHNCGGSFWRIAHSCCMRIVRSLHRYLALSSASKVGLTHPRIIYRSEVLMQVEFDSPLK
jgi:hypothetical protein